MTVSRLLVKGGALVAPFLLIFALLALGGAGISRFFARLFAGSGHVDRAYGPYVIFAKKGSGRHDAAARVVQEFVANMVGEYGKRLRIAEPPAKPPIRIHLLDSHHELEERGLKSLNSDLANNGGFFLPPKLEIALVLTRHDADDERGLRHEMMHALMHLSRPDAPFPTWLSEGMASYFEHSRPVEGKWRAGGTSRDRPQLQNPLPLTQVLGARATDFMGEQNRSFYQSSHLLVAYLVEREPQKFFEFYDAVFRGGDRATFEKFFDPQRTEEGWHRYVLEPPH
ncbi:MAG: hypothetical protein HYY17_04480 [Planctomycetes bacterium]|nr:hypothetical protein [Planctomycetota bacterium]